jgi:undecaprenyl-diphosphatase
MAASLPLVARALDFDLRVACAASAAAAGRASLAVLRGVSRFGDLWLSLTAAIVLAVGDGVNALAAFAAATLAGLVVQKAAKAALARPRPCFVAGGPERLAPIPDAGSFPSGHTLHATLAAVAITTQVAPFAAVYVPLALLIGWSRVALGVHYPSDVAAGAALGAALGAFAVAL